VIARTAAGVGVVVLAVGALILTGVVHPGAAAPATPVTIEAPTSTPVPGECAAPAATPGGSDGLGGCFPGPGNVGVPAGTELTPYEGPCTITEAGTVIDAKVVDCDLDIQTTDVVITRSEVNGHIETPERTAYAFRVEDSLVNGSPDAPRKDRAIGFDNFVVLRSEIVGGNGGIYCRLDCTIQDSWIHGTDLDPTSEWHASAIRVEQHGTLIHNTFACDYTGPFNNPEIGCSADMTGYADFAPITGNTMHANLFIANPIGLGYCAYGGGTLGKPFTGDPQNATDIVFTDNVFQRGDNGKCGTWGAITDFLPDRPGNAWSGNRWSDGAPVPPT
jgi:hypothetical protein